MSSPHEVYVQAIGHLAFTLSPRAIKPRRGPVINYEADRFLRSLRRIVIRRPLWIYGVLLILGICLAYCIARVAKDDNGVPFLRHPTFYLGVPAILLGAYQAWLNSLVKQADQMKDSLNALYSEELFKIWFDLFYNYRNTAFLKFDELRDNESALRRVLQEHNAGRTGGAGHWHPVVLQGTPEEHRIDAFLSHLNILGEYYERGMLSLDEIGGVAEYYLLGVHNCYAFQAYVYRLRQAFRGEAGLAVTGKDNPYRQKFAFPPFRHACLLLYEVNRNCRTRETEVYELFDSVCGTVKQQEMT